MTTVLAGPILTPQGFREGVIHLDAAGRVEGVDWDAAAPPGAHRGVVLPRFVNAHTHVGDALARGRVRPGMSLEELVKPPDGLKHRMLREAAPGDVARGIRGEALTMARGGVRAFFDFREMGLPGLRQLQEGAGDVAGVTPVAFARPSRLADDAEEIDALFAAGADGLGLPSISDLPYEVAEAWAARARRAGKRFALHASEGVREDIDRVLALRPDFLVHMVKATREDLARVAAARVPIVLCPRSNAYFGGRADVAAMLEAGIPLALGTDNAMLQVPSLLDEMAFLHRSQPGVPRMAILRMAAGMEAQIFKAASAHGFLERGALADLVVLRERGPDPLDAAFAPDAAVSLVLADGRPPA